MGANLRDSTISAVISGVVGFLLTVYVQPLIATTLAPPSPQSGGPTTAVAQPSPESPPPPPEPTPPPSEPTPPPPPPEPAFFPGLHVEDVVAKDGDKRAGLRIAVLDAEHYWPLGRADTIVGPGGREEDVFAFFNSSGLQRRIAEAEDLIAVGMASCEDVKSSEEARAQHRAYKLISWVRQFDSLHQNARLYTVNLGQYKDPGCGRKSAELTRHQRNALLVAVMFKENIDEPRELGQLLKKHLMKKDGLALDIDRYSRPSFVLNRRD